LLVHLQDT